MSRAADLGPRRNTAFSARISGVVLRNTGAVLCNTPSPVVDFPASYKV